VKRLLAAVLAFLVATPSFAVTSYYFSNCDGSYSGPDYGRGDVARVDSTISACSHSEDGIHPINACRCNGTLANCNDLVALAGTDKRNPYCLAPAGFNESTGGYDYTSFAAVASAANIHAGDTFYLCAGQCDGLGSATYHVGPTITSGTGNGSLLVPRVSGSNGSPIQILPYCENGTCETVTISGDSNGNGSFDAGEIQHFMTNAAQSPQSAGSGATISYWTIDGDPLGTATHHIIFDKCDGIGIELDYTDPGGGDQNNHDGVANVTFKHFDVMETGARIWGKADLEAANCDSNSANSQWFAFKINNSGGPVVLQDLLLKHICGVGVRYNNNNDASASLLADGIRFEDVVYLTNDNNFNVNTSSTTSYHVAPAASITYQNCEAHGFIYGIQEEDNIHNLTVQDNRLYCDGLYRTDPYCSYPGNYSCLTGISMTDGDTPPCTGDCWSDNYIIRRNTVIGTGNKGSIGDLWTGIAFGVTNRGNGVTALIENNTVSGANDGCDGTGQAAGLSINTAEAGVVARNNSISSPTSIPGGTAHTLYINGHDISFTNNIVSGGATTPYANFTSSAAGSTITTNDFYAGAGLNLLRVNATNYTCATIPTLQTGNICSKPSFSVDPSSTDVPASLALWGSQACVDAGASCSTDDLQGTTRPIGSACDIGAFEYLAPVSTTKPSPVTYCPGVFGPSQ